MDMDALAQELFDCTRILSRGPMKGLHALTGGELRVLGYLAGTEAEVTPTALSEELRISTARVANVLNGLEKKGYVLRERSLSDRRRVYVHVTEAGRALARQEQENAITHLREMLTDLGEQDAAEYLRLTRRIVALIQAHEAALDASEHH